LKVVAVLGSGRINGNSRKALEAAIGGLDKDRHEVETILLSKLGTMKPCVGCDGCRNAKRQCVVKDDLVEVIKKTREADAVIIASPVYYFGLNSMVKIYIDRLFYSSEAIDGQPSLLANKRIGFILSYGDVDPYTSGAVNAINTIKDIANYVGFDLMDIVYGTTTKEKGPSKKMLSECKGLGKRIVQESKR